jgi:thioredoxin-like negative regulator of GroEL/YHS domain-containing protein
MALGLILCICSHASAQTTSSYNGWSGPNDEFEWQTDFETAKTKAIKENKLILLHFTATWCRPCKTLDTFVFSSAEVQNALNETVVAVKVDADEHQEIVAEYGVTQVPFDVVITTGGKVVSTRRSPKDVRNYVHMLTSLNASSKDLRANSEGSLAAHDKLVNSSLEGTQQASFGAAGPKSSQIGLSADSTLLANRSNSYRPESAGTVQTNPFGAATRQNDQNQWVDREAMERMTFLEQQKMARAKQAPVNAQRRAPQIINNQFFDKAASPEAMTMPRASEMMAARDIEGRVEPNGPETGSEFQMPEHMDNGQMTGSDKSSVAMNTPNQASDFLTASAQPTLNQPPVPQPETVQVSTAPPEKKAEPKVDRSKFCLQGKCPVTLLKEGRWEDGDSNFGIVHRDRVYIFANAVCLEEFKKNPDGYSPVLAGYDPVVFHEQGKLADGQAKHGVFMGSLPNQRVVLFGSAETRAKFQSDPHAYLDTIRQAMNQADGAIMR